MSAFVDVILPLALPDTFTYSVPEALRAQVTPGKRVIVQFGKRKLYTALVAKVHEDAPTAFKPKPVLEVEDEQPVVHPTHLRFWQWMADYYMCTLGEILIAALPSGLKLESESVVVRNQLRPIDPEALSDAEYLVLEALESQSSLKIGELADILNVKNPLPVLQELLKEGHILLKEQLKAAVKPVERRMALLSPDITEESLNQIFSELQSAPKQSDLLLAYFQLGGKLGEETPILATKLLKKTEASDSALKALEAKGILRLEMQPLPSESKMEVKPIQSLSAVQRAAKEKIQEHFAEGKTSLLHGVTSSGKTEIYVELIAEQLEKGKSVLYLVPEIALTTQLIVRLQRYFGESVVVYHSRLNDRERVLAWQDIAQHEKPILMLGARSAVFLPSRNLGLIIVDEEHESSFKQQDPAPRYHARDAAAVLADLHQAHLLLGSATPSYESYHNAQTGKYGLVELKTRYSEVPLPEIQCIDLKEEHRRKRMHGPFSQRMLELITSTIEEGQQVILFQNRRGFNSMIQCGSCGHVLQCKNCDISLTYHKQIDILRCHYCGYSASPPKQCPACKSIELKPLGAGTEKIEEELQLQLPKLAIQRMDLDTTRKKNAYGQLIAQFENGEIDVLVGTQMLTKGLDFDKVGLVGIINADGLLHFPDFRANERAFQLMLQVAGRAGRKSKRGLVLIQSSEPYHNTIRKVMENDFSGMYLGELTERKQFGYPPFIRLIKITLKHRDREQLVRHAHALGKLLRPLFGERLLGPEFPLTARLRNLYIMEFILKLEPEVSRKKAKQLLREHIDRYLHEEASAKLQLYYDVDPV